MKKFSKIVLTAMLSLSLCVSSVVAVNALNVSNDVNAATVAMADYAKAITATNGGSAVYVANEKQLGTNATFTGIKLNAVAGATYTLGTFNIGASNWAGGINASAASTDGNANVSMLEYVAAPSAIDFGSLASQGLMFDFTFTQGGKSMTIFAQNYRESGKTDAANNDYGFAAQANGQSKIGCYRKTNGWRTWPGSVSRKGRITATDAQNMGMANSLMSVNAVGLATAANSFYYDFNDVALYSPLTLGVGTLAQSYLIRDFNSSEDAENGSDATWAGFDKDADGNCLVDVTLTIKSATGFTGGIILTKLGNTVFNANVEADVSVVANGNEFAGVEVNLTKFLFNAPFGEGVKVPATSFDGSIKVGADEATATAISGVAYTFQTSTNVYFYDAEGELLGSTAVSVVEEAPIAVSVTGGKAYYKRGDAEKVLITSETKFKIGDVITVEGGKFALLDQPIEEVKNFIVNGVEKATIVDDVATKIEGFEYVVTAEDLTTIDSKIEITLDNYCDVTFIDEFVSENVVKYAWQSNGSVSFPYASSKNPATYYGASGGEAALLGYYRYNAEDFKEGTQSGWNFWRSYDNNVGVDTNDSGTELNKYEALTKGMKFEAVYIKAEIISEYNVETNEVNIYLQVDQAHADNWKTLVAPTSEKPRLRMGYKFVDGTTSTALYSLDATLLDTYQIGGAYVPLVNGYYRYSFGSVTIPEGKNLQIQGYAILGTAQGGVTAGVAHKNTTYLKEIESKIAKVVKVAEGNTAGEGYIYSVKVDGVAYFSKLTVTDLQKLYTAAGKTNVITA